MSKAAMYSHVLENNIPKNLLLLSGDHHLYSTQFMLKLRFTLQKKCVNTLWWKTL